MESWRTCWREGFAPVLSKKALEALRQGLLDDDEALIQGATVIPFPALLNLPSKCEAGCAIGYATWKGEGLDTVGKVTDAFYDVCMKAGELLGTGPDAGIHHFLGWFDDEERIMMRLDLLKEVELALESK
jgi:hypothetical protein